MIVPLLLALQQTLSSAEKKIVARVDADAPQAIELLEKSVNINSGSLNRAGVKRVYDLFAPELAALGFDVRYVEQPDATRAGHLVAERQGKRGKRILLIGHLDTVFEESSPFQRFQRIDSVTASGPGTDDMKSGDVAIIYALRALNSVGALKDRSITVVMTGDEESTGDPLSAARAALVEAGKKSDVALAFEGGGRDSTGADMFAIARRSSTAWTLKVTGRAAHSSGIFGPATGAGAINEAARIINQFYTQLRTSPNVTFSPALIVGGNDVQLGEAEGKTTGKTNIVAGQAIVRGDLRTLTDEEFEQTRAGMADIVAQNLPQTKAELTWDEGYPPMPPTPAGEEFLQQIAAVNKALGLGEVKAYPPNQRGAGDISFVARYIAGADGFGARGSGSHTDRERVNIPSLHEATKRAAVLIYRLTNEKK